jgi:hypothetical protein
MRDRWEVLSCLTLHTGKERVIMKIRAWASIILLAVLCGCQDLGTVADSGAGSPSVTPTGKFVVDELSIDCQAKVNPRNDSLHAYFPVKLRYHFEDCPGSLSTMVFTFDRQFGVAIAIDGLPDSVGQIRSITPNYWTTTRLAQQESVLVECKLSGCYATFVDGCPVARESWVWTVERRLAVQR